LGVPGATGSVGGWGFVGGVIVVLGGGVTTPGRSGSTLPEDPGGGVVGTLVWKSATHDASASTRTEVRRGARDGGIGAQHFKVRAVPARG
jgi:hypothetical protein